jgi:hypothetical protein
MSLLAVKVSPAATAAELDFFRPARGLKGGMV